MGNDKYDDSWSVEELKNEPAYQQVEGRSGMDKAQLIDAMNSAGDASDGDDGDGDDGDTVVEVEEQPYEENYLGTAPEYRNSATDATAPITGDDDEDEITERVREMSERLASDVDKEPKSYEDWVGEKPEPGDRQGARGSNPVTRADKS